MNKVIIIGFLGNKPELSDKSQTPISNFRVATNESYNGKDGKKVEKTEWHNIVAFNKTAELCAEHLDKGRQVAVEGRLQTREYEKDGVKMKSTEIIADRVEFLGKKDDF